MLQMLESKRLLNFFKLLMKMVFNTKNEIIVKKGGAKCQEEMEQDLWEWVQ